MKFLITLFLFVPALGFAGDTTFEANCAIIGGNAGHSESVTLKGDSEFSLKMYDHEGELDGSSVCEFHDGMADCSIGDTVTTVIDFGEIQQLEMLTEVFEISIYEIREFKSLWECFIQ